MTADVVWYKSCRLMLALVSAWGYVFFYVLRIDLSFAIICMVKDPTKHTYSSNISNSLQLSQNSTNYHKITTTMTPMNNMTSCGVMVKQGSKAARLKVSPASETWL